MVSGGHGQTSVELLHANGTHLCSLPPLPAVRYYFTQTGLVACGGGGGSERTSCVTFSEGTWVTSHNLQQARTGHTSWASPQGLLLMGGTSSSRTTTELLNDNGGTTSAFTILNYDNRCFKVFLIAVFLRYIMFYF